MENSKKGYTPMMEKPNYRKSQGAKNLLRVERGLERVPNKSNTVIVFYIRNTELHCSCCTKHSMEAVWIRKFIDGLGSVMPSEIKAIEMLCDNEPALAIASDPEILKGARHFQRKYHYILEVIQEGEIVLKKVHTDDNVADPFTKPMPFSKHFEHAMAIGILPASSLMKSVTY
ncbi:hypothetical protein Tco_0193754 [Tanacetum coccineum]